MKALKCLGCQNSVVVSDVTNGYCTMCKIELQEDKYLNKELGLTKDEPMKPYKQIKTKKKKQSKIKHKKSKKKKQ